MAVLFVNVLLKKKKKNLSMLLVNTCVIIKYHVVVGILDSGMQWF